MTAMTTRIDRHAKAGHTVSLDAEMTHATADVICRTLFSEPLDAGRASDVFAAFGRFQDTVANVDLLPLLLGRPFAPVRQPVRAQAACADIRRLIADMIRARQSLDGPPRQDIAADILEARDPQTGRGFSLDELVDQIGVFFLAGHETTASTVTWALFLLSRHAELLAELRSEIAALGDPHDLSFAQVKGLRLMRAVVRETLRLYPPGPFLPRVALRDGSIGDFPVKRGSMVMISPWLLHRHRELWTDADRFDPSRFMGDAEKAIPAGAYIPFGLGPRICIGAAFASTEAGLLLATILARYDFQVVAPELIRPVARLTIRPAQDIQVRFRRRASQ